MERFRSMSAEVTKQGVVCARACAALTHEFGHGTARVGTALGVGESFITHKGAV